MKSSVVTIKFNDEDFVGEVVSVSGKHCLAKICGQTVFCHVNDSAAIFAGKHAPQYRDERMPLPTVGKKILVRVIEDPDHAGKWKGEVWGSYKEYESAVALIKNRSENPRAMKPCVPPVPKTPAKPYVPPVPKTPAMPERKPESAEKSEASASVRAVSSEGNAKDERRQGFAQRRHGGYRHHHGDHFRGKRH